MGDRTTPMKFGPEWLRNLSREPTGTGGSGAPSAPPAVRPVTSSAPASSYATASTKVQLAKLRYGREEMLALYDPQAAEAPVQLKTNELLYYSRGKSPYALNSNFEEETRDSGGIRNNPPSGAMSADRFGPGRGRGFSLSSLTRGNTVIEGRGRARLFARPTSSGSDTFRAPSWHNGAQRSYPGAPDDDTNSLRGLWNNGNGLNPPGIRPTAEQADWANKMAYRKQRQNQNHTNWRQQQNRDEGEEWRSDGARRGQDKWDREWPERGPQEKGWSTNRRHWVGDADELPEWAVENSEACGGTFDASGAFHGYSNDDSNIPKAQDSSYALSRSQTHGSFAQDFKQFAKRRFDAIEVKFKKPTDEAGTEQSGNPSATNDGANANSGQTREIPKIENIRNKLVSHEEPEKETPEMQEQAGALPAAREESKLDFNKGITASAQRNDLLRRTEERDPGNEQGTYKSVMMASNNQLRQRQNLTAPANKENLVPHRFQQMLDARKKMESDYQEQKQQQETKLVEDMLDMHLSEELQAQLVVNATTQSTGNPISVNSFANQMPSSGIQMRMNNPLTPGMGMNQQQPSSSQAQPTPEANVMQPLGISNSVLNASLGLPLTGSNMNMPPPPIPNPGVISSNLQGLGTGNMKTMQVGGLQSRMQVPGMPATSFQNAIPGNTMPGLQPNLQSSSMNTNNMQSASAMPSYQANSLFMGAPNSMQNPGELGNQGQNMYPMHGHSLQQSASQGSFNSASLYGNMMQPPPSVQHPNVPMSDLWYYEDPNKTIQGPFTSKEMYGWYHAGFFTPDLMVRRACESGLMPLASYGLMPFGSTDIMPPQFNMTRARYDLQQHENMLNTQQPGLGPEVESLWSMRESSDDMLWYRPSVPMPPPEQIKTILNNLSMFFWDQIKVVANYK